MQKRLESLLKKKTVVNAAKEKNGRAAPGKHKDQLFVKKVKKVKNKIDTARKFCQKSKMFFF